DESPTLLRGLGHGIGVDVERVVWGEPPLYILRSDARCAVANQWVSATPVALDRSPGDLFSRNPAKREAAYAAAAEIVTQSCVYSGLPRPEKVVISPTPMVPGSAAARQFQPFPLNEGKFRRVLVHVSLVFSESVQGPVLLGAGRFYGLGLFRPLTKRGSQR